MGLNPQQASDATSGIRQPVTIELVHPVMFGSERVERIVLQPITGREMRHVPLPVAVDNGRVSPDYYLDIASRASAYPPAVFDSLAPPDVLRVVHEVAAMVDPSVGTSEKA